MSQTTHEAHKGADHKAPQAGNGKAQENKAEAAGAVVIEIAGMEVTLPLKFRAGMVLTDNQAKVLDAAYQRQFTNNQNASAKSRAEALAKATTDEERAAKAPLTAAQIAALYTDYEPSVGGTPRQSMMEKLRHEAAWRLWTSMVTAHNDAVAKGGKPVIAKAGAKPVQLPSGKGAAEKREGITTALVARPEYAERVQAQLDIILAERGAKRTETAATEFATSGADLL